MTQRKPARLMDAAVLPSRGSNAVLADLRMLILQAREGVARAVDSALLRCIGMWAAASAKTSSRRSERTTASRLLHHWGDNWRESLGTDLARRTFAECAASPMFFLAVKLSHH